MKIVWERNLKTNVEHILIVKNEGEENWATFLLNALIIQIFKEYNRRETHSIRCKAKTWPS